MERIIRIQGARILTMDSSRKEYEEGYVVIKGNTILEVGPGRENRRYHPDVEIDGSGKVVIPGLINAHAHTRPLRGVGDGFSMDDWHRLYVDPVSIELNFEDSYAGGLLAFAEMIRSGTTSTLVMSNIPQGCAKAAVEIGIRARITPHAANLPDFRLGSDRFEDNLELVRDQENSGRQRVKYWFGFEGLLGTSPDLIRKIGEVASKYEVGIHTHVAETESEVREIQKLYGKGPLEYLRGLGLLGPNVTLTHCIWLDLPEIEILNDTRTKVVRCPISNMKLANGIAPVVEMKKVGVDLALGSDGMLSGFKLDMFEIMRTACTLQRISKRDARALVSQNAFEMATLGGAKALSLEREVGSIEEGKKADLTIIDFNKVHLTPLLDGEHNNLVPLLVFSAYGSDVDTVIIDGRIVLLNGKLQTVKEEKVIRKASDSACRILGQIKIRH